MAGENRDVTVSYVPYQWNNWHQNVSHSYERFYSLELPDDTDGTNIIRDMGATVGALQGILKEAIDTNKTLRCLGGGWSLSESAVTDDWLIDTTALNLYTMLSNDQVQPLYQKDVTGLYLAQCGISIGLLNERLEGNNRSLTTSGASDGQTIGGAIATGRTGQLSNTAR